MDFCYKFYIIIYIYYNSDFTFSMVYNKTNKLSIGIKWFIGYIFLLFLCPYFYLLFFGKKGNRVKNYKEYKKILYIFLVFFLIIIYILIFAKKKEILSKWDTYKCKPQIIPIAGFLNPPPNSDLKQKVDFTIDNANFCLDTVGKSIAKAIMKPFNLITIIISKTIEGIRKIINEAKRKLVMVKGFIAEIILKIIAKFESMTVVVAYLFKKLKDVLSKQHAIFLAVQNLVTGINTTLMGIVKGPFGKMATEMAKTIPDFWPLSSTFKNCMCFGENTLIELDNGSFKTIENIKIQDIIKGGSVVTGTIQYKSPNNYKSEEDGISIMYSYFSIVVAGDHLVQEKGVWKKVKNSNYSNPILYSPDKSIYCLITSDNKIIVNDITFTDFEEHSNNYIHNSIDILTTQVLNTPTKNLLENDYIIDKPITRKEIEHQNPMGIYCESWITLENSKQKQLKNIQIGDEILDSGCVLSIIHLDSSITKLYRYHVNKSNIDSKEDILCSGSQLILEDDKWMRVYQSKYSQEYPSTDSIQLLQVITTSGILIINSVVMRDFLEHRDIKLHNLTTVLAQIELNQ